MIKTTVMVEGMMCGMCEAHLNDAIRAAFKVSKVESSHKRKECVILSVSQTDKEKLCEVVTKTGYTFKGCSIKEEEKKGLFSFLKK